MSDFDQVGEEAIAHIEHTLFELVRQNSKAHTSLFCLFKRRSDPLEFGGVDDAEIVIEILEVLENALCLFGGCIRWYRLRDEACSSIAHIREDLFRGMRRKTLVGKGFVRHVHQIGKRMEQRAVEVEDERFVCSLFTHSCP